MKIELERTIKDIFKELAKAYTTLGNLLSEIDQMIKYETKTR